MEIGGAAGCTDARRPAAAASGPILPASRDVGLARAICVGGPFAAPTGPELDAAVTACGVAVAPGGGAAVGAGADASLMTTDVTGAVPTGLACGTAPVPYGASGTMAGGETREDIGAAGVLPLLAAAGTVPGWEGLVAGPSDSALAERCTCVAGAFCPAPDAGAVPPAGRRTPSSVSCKWPSVCCTASVSVAPTG